MVSAFFYGTLMHPEILKRVIGNDGSQLQMCPALLPVSLPGNLTDHHPDTSPFQDYTRHQLKVNDDFSSR